MTILKCIFAVLCIYVLGCENSFEAEKVKKQPQAAEQGFNKNTNFRISCSVMMYSDLASLTISSETALFKAKDLADPKTKTQIIFSDYGLTAQYLEIHTAPYVTTPAYCVQLYKVKDGAPTEPENCIQGLIFNQNSQINLPIMSSATVTTEMQYQNYKIHAFEYSCFFDVAR